jgi:YggT family protein
VVRDLLCYALSAYLIAVFGRILLSWFPIQQGTTMAHVFTFLYGITEPLLGPVRRAIPAMGGFDFSPIVVIIGIQIVQSAVLQCRVGLG